MDGTPTLTALCSFRTDLYACFTRRQDALFELTDARLSGSPVSSPVHLSLEPVHRRGWGSLYAALACGSLDSAAIQALVAATAPPASPPVYAVDVSVWPRCDAEASPDRGSDYHPSRHSAGQPIVAGWAYQWVAQVSFVRDSWTAPVDVRRVHPTANAHLVAAEQIQAILRRQPAGTPPPLFVFDAGSDPAWLARARGDAPVAVLVRLRRGRCFSADPTSQPATGRPRRHGTTFVCADPTTWPDPSAEHRVEDGPYGRVRVRAWAGLHAKSQNHPARGSRRTRPLTRGMVVLVEVERVPQKTRAPQPLWLWWRGPGVPDLDLLWRASGRRFDLEHPFRFVKQTLGWTTPRFRHPEQADRWTWLVVAAYTQLRLACSCVADRRLPWERPLPGDGLTPYRVRRALSARLLVLGTPAKAPQPCGRSPGRPKGRCAGPAPRSPALTKDRLSRPSRPLLAPSGQRSRPSTGSYGSITSLAASLPGDGPLGRCATCKIPARASAPSPALVRSKEAAAGRLRLIERDECGFAPSQPVTSTWMRTRQRKRVPYENPQDRRVNALAALVQAGAPPVLSWVAKPGSLGAEHLIRFLLYILPTYSPELNEVEPVFRVIKHDELPEHRYATTPLLLDAIHTTSTSYEEQLIVKHRLQPRPAA